MRVFAVLLFMFFAIINVTGCTFSKEPQPITEAPKHYGLVINKTATDSEPTEATIELEQITETVWIHTSYAMYKGHLVPSNGAIIIGENGLILIDTPWTDRQTEQLITLAEDKFKKPFSHALLTHAHTDRLGGMKTLKEKHIPVSCRKQTAELAALQGYPEPDYFLATDQSITVESVELEFYYPGPGHSPDNCVIWLEQDKLLYGGCLIKSKEASDLGELADASISDWQPSVQRVIDRYEDIKIVVPGHGQWGDDSLIDHTMTLLKNN